MKEVIGEIGIIFYKLLHILYSRLSSWLDPPVQAHLTAYGFHVVNPNSVVEGRKPILEEVGPFVYKAVTIKDSVNLTDGNVNLKYNDDGETLTYRPR